MVKHVVVFKFKGDEVGRRALAEKFAGALRHLPEQIEELREIEVGLNINTAEDCDLVLTAVVDNLEDVAIYSKHPAHLAATSIIAGNVDRRSCVDFQV